MAEKARCSDDNCGHIHEPFTTSQFPESPSKKLRPMEAGKPAEKGNRKYACSDPFCTHGHDTQCSPPREIVPVGKPDCIFDKKTKCRNPDLWAPRFEKPPMPPEKNICDNCLWIHMQE